MSNSFSVGPGKALVIMVSEDGQVENRVIDTPAGLAGFGPGGSVQLSECAAARPHPGRGAGGNPGRTGKRTRRCSTALTAKIVAEGLATLAAARPARTTRC